MAILMWFKRKPKNRRLGRDYVLDVKLRSTKVRAARTRIAAVGLGSFFALVLGAYLLWCFGEWTLKELVYENKAFAISEIDIQTDGIITVDQLRRWTGVKLDDNLLALDLARVKRDLELIPLIQSASVERILPRTLRIRVVEREPIAQINVPRPRANGGIDLIAFQLDPEGYVMLPLDPRQRATPPNQPAEQLPVISVLNPNEVQPGRRLMNPQVQAALQLILVFERSPMAGLVDLKRIDLSAPEVLTVATGQGSAVTFSLSDLEQQLRRWREVFETSQKLGKAIATLDLAITNNIPASFLEASAVPQITPKQPKIQHTRKKHV